MLGTTVRPARRALDSVVSKGLFLPATIQPARECAGTGPSPKIWGSGSGKRTIKRCIGSRPICYTGSAIDQDIRAGAEVGRDFAESQPSRPVVIPLSNDLPIAQCQPHERAIRWFWTFANQVIADVAGTFTARATSASGVIDTPACTVANAIARSRAVGIGPTNGNERTLARS